MKKKEKIIAYKGFESDMSCRGFKYQEGKTYKFNGEVELCERGFHACLNPIDVFDYYKKGDGNKYHKVEISGIKKDSDFNLYNDSKVVASEIKILEELSENDMKKEAEIFAKKYVDFEDKFLGYASNNEEFNSIIESNDIKIGNFILLIDGVDNANYVCIEKPKDNHYIFMALTPLYLGSIDDSDKWKEFTDTEMYKTKLPKVYNRLKSIIKNKIQDSEFEENGEIKKSKLYFLSPDEVCKDYTKNEKTFAYFKYLYLSGQYFDRIGSRNGFWLRAVASSAHFCCAHFDGVAYCGSATIPWICARPAFLIKR